eukprot:3627175-Rhodomonas_salina.1
MAQPLFCYEVSGTAISYAAIPIRLRYAMSGTDIGYAAIPIRLCYAMSGTDIGYAATRSEPREQTSSVRYATAYAICLRYMPKRSLCDPRCVRARQPQSVWMCWREP